MDCIVEVMTTPTADVASRLEIHVYDLRRPTNVQSWFAAKKISHRSFMPYSKLAGTDGSEVFVEQRLEIDASERRIDIAPGLDWRAGAKRGKGRPFRVSMIV